MTAGTGCFKSCTHGNSGRQRAKVILWCQPFVLYPIPTKFSVRVAPHNVIEMSNFSNKIFRGFRSTVSQNPQFSVDFAGHRYNSVACDLTTGLSCRSVCRLSVTVSLQCFMRRNRIYFKHNRVCLSNSRICRSLHVYTTYVYGVLKMDSTRRRAVVR